MMSGKIQDGLVVGYRLSKDGAEVVRGIQYC